MRCKFLFSSCVLLASIGFHFSAGAQDAPNGRDDPTTAFARAKLVAWCIVPFDGKQRGPAERAKMIKRLGMRRVAYDWRQKHVAEFEQEILEYKKHDIEYFAFWSTHEQAFKLFEKHGLHPQIWQTLPSPPGDTQQQRVRAAAKQMLPLVERTRKLGSKLGLYNHGGWGGEPENLVAVCKYLREHHDADHVGIVYNQHHAHSRIGDFAEIVALMKPYLLCLNLNGMATDGDKVGKKILPLGEGEHDVRLIKAIRDSGYRGPIGIIGHTQDDVEQRLLDNLEGLEWILPQLGGKPAAPKPKRRTWHPAKEANPRPAEFSKKVIEQLLARSRQHGDPRHGLMVFSSAKSACLSCHKIGKHGGDVGPNLSEIGKQRPPAEIVEAVLWPSRTVKKEFIAHQLLLVDGTVRRGYILKEDKQELVLRDPTKRENADSTIALEDIEARREIGSLMPDNLSATLSDDQLEDLIGMLVGLGRKDGIPLADIDSLLEHVHGHLHGPADFPYDRKPLHPEHWPSWKHHVNRDRVYDFYAKEADFFRQQATLQPLLPEFPGLDGGKLGHWGNQNEKTWANAKWNATRLGTVQCGTFRGAGVTVPRGVCVRISDEPKVSVCFNPDTLSYDAVWTGGFVKFSSVRHGFLHGLLMDGKPLPKPARKKPGKSFQYHGFYLNGDAVTFAYRIGDQDFLETPRFEDGKFTSKIVAVKSGAPGKAFSDAPAQWPQVLETPIELGRQSPYTVDTIRPPFENPWNALMFFGGHAFLPDGSALICTMQGDVWHVRDFEYPSKKARWRRFAAGLFHAQGVVVDDDGIFVLGRDQITRLHDLNKDGEADFYECFSNAYETSTAGHDFICGLQRDAVGNFFTASGRQGVVCISADGKQADVVATGFRNPDGIGVTPDGLVTVPCSEGGWTPASMICAFRPGSQVGPRADGIPYFGYGGPRNGKPPALPMAYLPRGIDNSSGGQTTVISDRWGPLQGQILHFSFGAGSHFLLLRDEIDGQPQGAIVPLPGEFRSGAHRGRFSPADGQLYVSGMQGWGSYTPEVGCFQRVRYTGGPVQLPIGFRTHENGVAVQFSSPLDRETASRTASHFAQCWNYRYSQAYGSPEFSTKHFGIPGHDSLKIQSAHVSDDGKTLFIEIPELQPVNQLHLLLQSSEGEFHELFITVHKLAKPFTDFPGYKPRNKRINPHPILADLAIATKHVPNRHAKKIKNSRRITIETGTNLSYATRSFRVQPGERIAFTLSNPDVVPHNWALVKPGTMQRVGQLANRLISDPKAAIRQYIPQTEDVLVHTDVVPPRGKFTVYFLAPKQPGRYPYLCTFPGHWLVMNGEMIVEGKFD